jgi:ubiquinone/menaquinone biosynthesis C-methylase UbiE
MSDTGDFWDSLAPQHWRIENSYFKLNGLNRISSEIRPPVLVVGAGQGLIVEELLKRGMPCVGIDLSAEMIRYAASRRGITLVRANATALPFARESFGTIIFATGVIDFTDDECAIRAMLEEGKRALMSSGTMFAAFYRMSSSSEQFLENLGLLESGKLQYRQILEFYRLPPAQALRWIAAKSGVSKSAAALQSIRCWLLSTLEEKRNAVSMQRMFADRKVAEALLESAPISQPYRNEEAIHSLLARLGYPLNMLYSLPNCHIAQLK